MSANFPCVINAGDKEVVASDINELTEKLRYLNPTLLRKTEKALNKMGLKAVNTGSGLSLQKVSLDIEIVR